MEITLEQIDNLRERANVSYAEAKEALENAGGNMIDAIILLESTNKTVNDRVKRAQSRQKQYERTQERKEQYKANKDEFVSTAKKILKQLNESRFVVYNDHRNILDVPVLVTIIITVLAFPPVLVLFVIGLLTGHRYKVIKKGQEEDAINRVFDKAAEVSKNVADTIKEKVNETKEEKEEEHKVY